MMKKKNVTIDDLATMAQREFTGMRTDRERGFQDVHRKLNRLDKTSEVILKKLDGVVYRYEFDKLKIRV